MYFSFHKKIYMGCYSASKGKDLSHFVIDNLGERNDAA